MPTSTASAIHTDLGFLALLTSATSGPMVCSQSHHRQAQSNTKQSNRRPQLDPLILRTIALSSPGQTRNHYLHEYFPDSFHQHHQQHHNDHEEISQHLRLKEQQQQHLHNRRPSIPRAPATKLPTTTPIPSLIDPSRSLSLQDGITKLRKSLENVTEGQRTIRHEITNLKCQARTRIPSDHGAEIEVYAYTSKSDHKEHLAFVIGGREKVFSQSLESIWNPKGESELDRFIRGAKLEQPITHNNALARNQIPIVRIHSECFTGETLCSRRCDCGEQFNKSFEFILKQAEDQRLGIIIYLRQEGRGIGLINKLKAYNLQDLGFDTLESNLLLGFDIDMRDYEISQLILEDLGMSKIKLMTNNPRKISFFDNHPHPHHDSNESNQQQNKIQVVERIPMIPDQWQNSSSIIVDSDSTHLKLPGPSKELNDYLRTKVIKMS